MILASDASWYIRSFFVVSNVFNRWEFFFVTLLQLRKQRNKGVRSLSILMINTKCLMEKKINVQAKNSWFFFFLNQLYWILDIFLLLMRVILIRNIYEKIISNHKIDEFDIKFFWPREYTFIFLQKIGPELWLKRIQ